MASVKGTNMTLITGGGGANDFVDVGAVGGRVRLAMDVYEAAALGIGSDIHIARLPKGARLLPQSCIVSDALGAGVTLEVGDGTDTDKFMAATVNNTANLQTFMKRIDGSDELTDVTDIYITTGAGAATGTIRSFIFYTMD